MVNQIVPITREEAIEFDKEIIDSIIKKMIDLEEQNIIIKNFGGATIDYAIHTLRPMINKNLGRYVRDMACLGYEISTAISDAKTINLARSRGTVSIREDRFVDYISRASEYYNELRKDLENGRLPHYYSPLINFYGAIFERGKTIFEQTKRNLPEIKKTVKVTTQ